MDKSLIIRSLGIDSFRGLNNLMLDDFSRVNISVGANNSGKTSVLEALKLISSPSDMGYLVHLAFRRAQWSADIRKKNMESFSLRAMDIPIPLKRKKRVD